MCDFLIVGPQNACTYKNVFPYLKDGRVSIGLSHVKEFDQQDGTPKKFGNIRWFTNIEHGWNGKPLELTKSYSPDEYPKYDNYDAIEVSRVADIPVDYDGVMGVPITFLDKWCSDQFEIVGTSDRGGDNQINWLKNQNWDGLWDSPFVNGNKVYKRLLIRRKDHLEPADFEIVGMMTGAADEVFEQGNDGRKKFYLDGKAVYARVIISRKS